MTIHEYKTNVFVLVVCMHVCVCACVCVRERERERDQNQDFTVLQKWISFFRYLTNITANMNKRLGPN